MPDKKAENVNFSTVLTDNKSEVSKIEKFENTKITATPRNLAIAGAGVVTIGVGALFATQIIAGTVAIAAAGALLIVGGLALKAIRELDPVIAQKLKNYKLELMYNEAKDNAIYQLSNQVLRNDEILKGARKQCVKLLGIRNRIETKVEKAKPANKPKFQKMLTTVEESYEITEQNTAKLAKTHILFAQKVDEYREYVSFNDIINEFFALAGENDKLSEMLSMAAFEQIETDLSESLAKIELSTKYNKLDAELEGGE